jgi:hypothetical protein
MKYFLVLCLVFLSSQWALAGEIIADDEKIRGPMV